MGRVEGKVALVTGAGRGQGRSHAVRLASEGADIIAVDICRDFDTVSYPMSSPEDLKETVRLVEEQGRKIVAVEADVRDRMALNEAVAAGVKELGKLDVVVAQAGILPMNGEPAMQAWADGVDTILLGTINAIHASLPYLEAGASIIATGSAAAFMPHDAEPRPGADPGGAGYMYAKRALSEFVHELARNCAPRSIRVNTVHPTNVDTHMLQNDVMYRTFRPDLEKPERKDAELGFYAQQAMPIPYVQPIEISNAVLWLASDEAQYVTGMQLRVDAGSYLKFHAFHV